jgi:predicted outer membrane protein
MAFASQNGQAAQQKKADTIDARDREFLTVINFANMWEMPMGKLATERGTTQAVKDAGATMLTDHTKLNVVVNQLADKYGVQLPDKPSSSTQGWMNEISSKQGEDFDKTFADRLRAAHGTVFGLIAEVRAGTRNATMRDFATQANTIVMKHMTLLEKTGYVSADHGMFGEAAARSASYPENQISNSALLLGGVIFLVVAAGTVLGVRTLSARGAAK